MRLAPLPLVVASVLGAAVVLTGCAEEPPSSAPPGTVRIEDFQFIPQDTVIATGETVTWTNDDPNNHWILSAKHGTSVDGTPNVLDSGDLGHAQSWKWAFDAPGEYPYYCKIHNYMKGTVRVQQPEGQR
jgi:plastocyanin